MTLEEKDRPAYGGGGPCCHRAGLASGLIEGIRAADRQLSTLGSGKDVQKMRWKDKARHSASIGFDVLHGHRTIFLIPLAEQLFDPLVGTQPARRR
jgi:hypothetical protein